MNRDDLTQESDGAADRPDPWGDIPDVEAVGEAREQAPSQPQVASPEPSVTPKRKARSRRRKEQTKPAPLETNPTIEEGTIPAAEPWAEVTPVASEPDEDLAPSERPAPRVPPELTPPTPSRPPPPRPPVLAPAEPPDSAPASLPNPAAPEPPAVETAVSADPTPPADAPPVVPPWPDRALDVLPYADRAAWPGTRKRTDRDGDDMPPTTSDSPPAPAVAPDDTALDAYALPPPSASAKA